MIYCTYNYNVKPKYNSDIFNLTDKGHLYVLNVKGIQNIKSIWSSEILINIKHMSQTYQIFTTFPVNSTFIYHNVSERCTRFFVVNLTNITIITTLRFQF